MVFDMIMRSYGSVYDINIYILGGEFGDDIYLLDFILELRYPVHMRQFLQHCAVQLKKTFWPEGRSLELLFTFLVSTAQRAIASLLLICYHG